MQLRKYTVDGPFESEEQLDQNWTKIEEEFEKKANSTHNHDMDNINGLSDALAAKLDVTLKGQEGGLAELDANGQVKQVMNSATVRNYQHSAEIAGKIPVALKSLYLIDGYDNSETLIVNDFSDSSLLFIHIVQTALFDWFASRLQLPNTLIGLIVEGNESINELVIDNLSTSQELVKILDVDDITLPDSIPASIKHLHITGTNLSSFNLSALTNLLTADFKNNAFDSDALDDLLISAKTLAVDNNKQDVVLNISGNLGMTTLTDIIETLTVNYNWTIIYDEEGQYV
jgi:hypothetical protein